MACVAKSVANCLISAFTTPKALYSVSVPARPVKFQLFLPSLFLMKPITRVAVQREDSSPVLLQDQEYRGNFNLGQPENGQDPGDAEEGDGYIEPSENLNIYVKNLPYDVDSENLANLFQEAGVVEIAEVIYNRETDQSRGFGFVTMSTIEEVDKAIEMFNKYDLGGRYLTVSKASPKGSRLDRPPRVSERSNRIYVGNLPWSVYDERLEQVFSEHGKVVSARVISDRETGRSRGFGFVIMASESEMNEAIANLDGKNIDGRAIRVNVAEERQNRVGF